MGMPFRVFTRFRSRFGNAELATRQVFPNPERVACMPRRGATPASGLLRYDANKPIDAESSWKPI